MIKLIAGLVFISLFTGCGDIPPIGVKKESNENVIAVRTGGGITDFEVHFIEKDGHKFAVAASYQSVSIIQIQE